MLIGRGGSSLKDKNILPVLGVPLLYYTAAAARSSEYIGRFYISSDCGKILDAGEKAGYSPIVRPPELSTASSQSVDVVRHALGVIESEGDADIVVVQHANVGTISKKIIDECIHLLLSDNSLSAVVPVHEKSEYHPYRAKMLTEDGLLTPFFDFAGGVSGNRQDLPKAYFFDHSIWVLNVENGIKSAGGQPPWDCMGKNILPYVTTGCFDVHDMEDLKKTEEWILANDIDIPFFG